MFRSCRGSRKLRGRRKNSHHALQGLWGIEAAAELDDDLAIELLAHPYPYVRFWTVRLLGDRKTVSSDVAEALLRLAEHEQSPVVLAQLAASAKRLPGSQGLPLVEALLRSSGG